jgi:hypothetical protein
MMKRELTLAGLMGFAPDTPCVAHVWMVDDFDDIDPELTPGEVTAAIELADRTLDADTYSLSLRNLEEIMADRCHYYGARNTTRLAPWTRQCR